MRLLLSVLLLLLVAPSYSGDRPRLMLGSDARIEVEQVALDPSNRGLKQVGALTYLGGIRLTSPDPAFGGFSAMQVTGDRFTLVSDGGNVVRFRMGKDWRPREVTFGDVPGPGTGWPKFERDIESLTVDAHGRIWAGFEGSNAIWRYDSTLNRSDRHAAPLAMAKWPPNGGPEAMTRLADGGFVVISERGLLPRLGDAREAIRFAGDPVEAPNRGFVFAYRPPAGYDPSDMAALLDGRLLVLNRRVSVSEWFTAKLVLLDPAAIRPGAVAEGRELATIERPMTRDNFEALAVTREGGATIVWLATDDNRELFEQSLLMKFRLDLPAGR